MQKLTIAMEYYKRKEYIRTNYVIVLGAITIKKASSLKVKNMLQVS